MTTRANSFGGLFFEATEKEEANYETSPEDGDDHYVSTNHLLDNYLHMYMFFVHVPNAFIIHVMISFKGSLAQK